MPKLNNTLLRERSMVGNSQVQLNLTIMQFVERILDVGQLNRLDHLQLVTTFLSDYKVNDEERNQINRVFDDLQIGRLKLGE